MSASELSGSVHADSGLRRSVTIIDGDARPKRERGATMPAVRRVDSVSSHGASATFTVGTSVEVVGLVRRKELNGVTGSVTGYTKVAQSHCTCMVVRLSSGEEVSLKGSNLRKAEKKRPETPPISELHCVPTPSLKSEVLGSNEAPVHSRELTGCDVKGSDDGTRSLSEVPVPPVLQGVTCTQSFATLYAQLCERGAQKHFGQDEVRYKNTRGLLYLLIPHDPSVHVYVCWLPYCLHMTIDPSDMTARARRALDGRDGLPLCVDESFDGPFLPAWEHACLIPDARLVSVRKQGKAFGNKSLLFNCIGASGSATVGPFVFSDGGMSKWVDEMLRLVKADKDPQDDTLLVCDHHLSLSECVTSPGSHSGQLGSVQDGSFNRGQVTPPPADCGTPPDSTLSPPSAPHSGLRGAKRWESAPTRAAPRSEEGKSPSQPPEHQPMRQSFATKLLNSLLAKKDPQVVHTPRGSPDQEPGNTPTLFTRVSSGLPRPQPIPEPPRERGERVSVERWLSIQKEGCVDADGWQQVKEEVFASGLVPEIRQEVWCYMLGVYDVGSTPEERAQRKDALEAEYKVYKTQWTTITERQRRQFRKFRDLVSRIEKDVHRTDRTVPLYTAEGGSGLQALLTILTTYAFFNFDVGYCQGMSDILSPIYWVVQDEALAFWGFVNVLDERLVSHFSKDQKGMTAELSQLGCLVELTDPDLHRHLDSVGALNCFFCFRWCLVHFKREFDFDDTIRLWDVLWACPITKNWHLFMACSVLRLARSQILEHAMGYDEILKFVNEMSHRMDLDRVLSWTEHHYHELPQVEAAPARRPSLSDLLRADEERSPLRSGSPSVTAADDSLSASPHGSASPLRTAPVRPVRAMPDYVAPLVDASSSECVHLRLLRPDRRSPASVPPSSTASPGASPRSSGARHSPPKRQPNMDAVVDAAILR